MIFSWHLLVKQCTGAVAKYFINNRIMKKSTIIVCLLLLNSFCLHAQTSTIPYPIIFVHGLVGAETTWGEMGTFLYSGNRTYDVCLNHDKNNSTASLIEGFNGDIYYLGWRGNGSNSRIYAVNFDNERFPLAGHETHYLSNQAAIFKQGKALRKVIEAVLEEESEEGRQTDKVILVGHSMGGLAIREYLQRGNGINWIDPNVSDGHKVAKVVTIGTPHRGSNANKFGIEEIFSKVNNNSEAVRDLRYYGLNFTGVYLFGGYEYDLNNPLGDLIPENLFYNHDIDCNTSPNSDLIIGINETNDGTYDNQNQKLPTNIHYSWIVGYANDFKAKDDGVVEVLRQFLFEPSSFKPRPLQISDTINIVGKSNYLSLFHTNETKEIEGILRGLDEPELKNLAYKIPLGNSIRGRITYRSNNNGNTLDVDVYKITTPAGRLTISLNPNSSPTTGLDLSDDNGNIASKPGSGPQNIIVNNTTPEDKTYYVWVNGNANSNSYNNEYMLSTSVKYLSSPLISPTIASSTEPITFTVRYTSDPSEAPDYIRIVVDGIPYNMSTLYSNWASPGAIYSYVSGALSSGTHNYYFVASSNGDEDIRYPSTGTLSLKVGQIIEGLETPIITSFTPSSGIVGAAVTITGTNFSTTPGNNIVHFGATKATVTAATTTQLTVTVPVGATFAPITVTTNNLTTYSQKFFMPTFNGTGILNSSSFAAKVDFTTAQGESYFTTLADFDGDGKPDLAVANYTPSTSTVSVFRNTATLGAITSGSFATKIDLTAGERPAGVAVGDLDGDGKLDLVVVNQTSNTISVFRNSSNSTGSITFSSKVDFATTNNPATLTISDLDADGKPEVIVANNGGSSVSVFKNTSVVGSITTGSFAGKQDFTTGPNPIHINVGDLDGDGKSDLVTANGDNTVCVLRNTSVKGIINSSSFASKVNFPAGNGAINVAIGDIDGDGKQDLALTNLHAATLSVLRNTSSPGIITAGSFAAKVDFSTGTRPIGVSIGDLDGDGKLDISVVCEGTNTVSVYKNKATSGVLDVNSLATKVDYSKAGLSYEVTIGDIDGDGKPELVVGNGVNSVSVFHNRSSTTTAPLFYYNFDDQIKDQTLNNHNGTTQGTPVYVASTSGRGKAASFNDTWRIVVSNSKPSDFALSGAWTIAFSLKPETNVDWGNGFLQRIGDDGTCNRRGPILLINNNTTAIPPICGFHGTDYFNGNGKADNPAITGMQIGSWNRLIFVHRADNTGDIYVNGVKIHSNISMKVADFGTKLMSLGGNYLNDGCYGADYANNVTLDDFALFNIELKESEISSDGLETPVGLPASCSKPAQPGVISGNVSVCDASSQSYSITAVTGATSYLWTLPSGWTGTSTTNSITATIGSASGNISVVANNACGASTARTLAVTVNTVLAQPGVITGNVSVCAASSQTYSVTAVTGATSYTWTLPSGWTGTSATNSITTTIGSAGGNISVVANNACGASTARTIAVTVNPVPAKPQITSNFDDPSNPILTSNSPSGNQWYFSNSPIASATNQSYSPKEQGGYSVQVTLLGCSSLFSETFPVIITGDVDHSNKVTDVYPNPAETILIITGINDHSVEFKISDLLGRSFKLSTKRIGDDYQANVGELAPGPYLLLIKEGNSIRRLRFIKK